jgi:integral membrane protein (TIGR01906 family)
MQKTKNKKREHKKFPEQKILVIVSIVLLVFVLFVASFFMVFFDRSFYDKEFKKYGQYDELGIVGVQKTVDYLINYLTSENSEIDKIPELNGFTSEEKAHLIDVRAIINSVKWIGIISFILLIAAIMRLYALKDFRNSIRRILVYSSISALALLIIIFVLSLNFPSFFEGFHKLLFPQGNYTFPADYLLIKLFPEALFKDYARKMFFHIGILSLILLVLGSSLALAFNNPRRH